jgi:hypothetical protein
MNGISELRVTELNRHYVSGERERERQQEVRR